MIDPVFISYDSGCALHQWGLQLHGGVGVPDSGRLASALEQPKFAMQYGNPDHFDIAAHYAYNISHGHVFDHGNKTAAALTALTYLELNGIHTGGLPNKVLYDGISGLAGGASKEALSDIFRRYLRSDISA